MVNFTKSGLITISLGYALGIFLGFKYSMRVSPHLLSFQSIFYILLVNVFIFTILTYLYSLGLDVVVLLWIFGNSLVVSYVGSSAIMVFDPFVGSFTLLLGFLEQFVIINFCNQGLRSIKYMQGVILFLILANFEVIIYDILLKL